MNVFTLPKTSSGAYATVKIFKPHVHIWRLAMNARFEVCMVCEGCADVLTGKEVERIVNERQ